MLKQFEKIRIKTPGLVEALDTRIFEVFGLQYFSLKSVIENGAPKKLPYSRICYMLLVMGIYMGFLSVFLLADREYLIENVTSKTVLTYVILHSMKIGLFIVIFVSLLQSFLSTKKVAKIYEHMQKISQIVTEDFKVVQNYLNIRKKLRFHGFLMFLFFVLTEIFFISFCQSLEKAIIQTCYIVPIFFLLLNVYKFIFYVQLINSQLENLVALTDGIFLMKSAKCADNQNIYLMPVKVHKNSDDIFRKFLSAKRIYNILYESGSLVNEAMGLTLLILLIIFVIALTASGYQIFVILVGGKEKDKINETIYTMILGSTVLIVIVSVCQRTHRLMSNLATGVSRIECESYEQMSEECREFVHKFYMQLNHQPIIFTAYGFYTINLALLASITTGIVSYQIILVQFYAT